MAAAAVNVGTATAETIESEKNMLIRHLTQIDLFLLGWLAGLLLVAADPTFGRLNLRARYNEMLRNSAAAVFRLVRHYFDLRSFFSLINFYKATQLNI